MFLLFFGACALTSPRTAPALAVRRSPIASMSIFFERPPSPDELRRKDRIALVAARYGLDPVVDSEEVVALAASSLPEEETGTWLDVGICAVQNLCVVAALLAAVGALPGQASASEFASSTSLLADAESDGVIAIIAVPLLVGGALVAALAVGYPMIIRKIQQGDR